MAVVVMFSELTSKRDEPRDSTTLSAYMEAEGRVLGVLRPSPFYLISWIAFEPMLCEGLEGYLYDTHWEGGQKGLVLMFGRDGILFPPQHCGGSLQDVCVESKRLCRGGDRTCSAFLRQLAKWDRETVCTSAFMQLVKAEGTYTPRGIQSLFLITSALLCVGWVF